MLTVLAYAFVGTLVLSSVSGGVSSLRKFVPVSAPAQTTSFGKVLFSGVEPVSLLRRRLYTSRRCNEALWDVNRDSLRLQTDPETEAESLGCGAGSTECVRIWNENDWADLEEDCKASDGKLILYGELKISCNSRRTYLGTTVPSLRVSLNVTHRNVPVCLPKTECQGSYDGVCLGFPEIMADHWKDAHSRGEGHRSVECTAEFQGCSTTDTTGGPNIGSSVAAAMVLAFLGIAAFDVHRKKKAFKENSNDSGSNGSDVPGYKDMMLSYVDLEKKLGGMRLTLIGGPLHGAIASLQKTCRPRIAPRRSMIQRPATMNFRNNKQRGLVLAALSLAVGDPNFLFVSGLIVIENGDDFDLYGTSRRSFTALSSSVNLKPGVVVNGGECSGGLCASWAIALTDQSSLNATGGEANGGFSGSGATNPAYGIWLNKGSGASFYDGVIVRGGASRTGSESPRGNGALRVQGGSSVDIYGGIFEGGSGDGGGGTALSVFDRKSTTSAKIHGGSFAGGSGSAVAVAVSESLRAWGSKAVITVLGGTFAGPWWAIENAKIFAFGCLSYTIKLNEPDEKQGILEGILADGSPINVSVSLYTGAGDTLGRIEIVPAGDCAPSTQPSLSPRPSTSVDPSSAPSHLPSFPPSAAPSMYPSSAPSHRPSFSPSAAPSVEPTTSVPPSARPTLVPSTSIEPSLMPSSAPSSSGKPSAYPTLTASSLPTVSPSTSNGPSAFPSAIKSTEPSSVPTPEETSGSTFVPGVRGQVVAQLVAAVTIIFVSLF